MNYHEERGWNRWSKNVYKSLEENAVAHESIRQEGRDAHKEVMAEIALVKEAILEKINEDKQAAAKDNAAMKIDIAVLKVKSGLWGAGASMIVVGLAILTKVLNFW